MSYYSRPSPNYPYVRPVESVSSQAAVNDQYLEALSITNAKFNASRTFEFEDDVEFCPVLSDEMIQYSKMTAGSASHFNDFQTTPPHMDHNFQGYQQIPSQGHPNPYYLGSPVSRQAEVRVNGGRRVATGSEYGRMERLDRTSSPGPGSQGSPLRYVNQW
jgi:hypothetical protein